MAAVQGGMQRLADAARDVDEDAGGWRSPEMARVLAYHLLHWLAQLLGGVHALDRSARTTRLLSAVRQMDRAPLDAVTASALRIDDTVLTTALTRVRRSVICFLFAD
jgi:hypothetical protein